MNRFYVVIEGNGIVSFATENQVIDYIEEQALERQQTPAEFIHDAGVIIVEGEELLYKPPRETASLVLKGK